MMAMTEASISKSRRSCLQVCRFWKHRVINLGLVALFLCVVRLLLGAFLHLLELCWAGDEGDFELILVKLGGS